MVNLIDFALTCAMLVCSGLHTNRKETKMNIDNYQEVNGTFYSKDTPIEVINALEYCRKNNIKVRFCYGDQETGKDYKWQNDTVGYIRRSMGPIKVPILICNKKSTGGPALFDKEVVKIQSSKKNGLVYYCHKTYKVS